MATSSIHIEKGRDGFIPHNDRSIKTANSIFPQTENEVWNYKKEAFPLYRSELEKRTKKYKDRVGRNLHKKAWTHISAIVNLNAHHTLKDVQKVGHYLQEEYDTKVFQIGVHKDEGKVIELATGNTLEAGKEYYVSEEDKKLFHDKDFQHPMDMSKYKIEKNYHAHIEFLGLDSEGISVRKKFTKSSLIKLQTKVAEILEMERGTCYAAEKKPRPKRFNTYEFKANRVAIEEKRRESQAQQNMLEDELSERPTVEELNEQQKYKKQFRELAGSERAKNKDLKTEVAELKAKLQAQGAKRPQYAEMEQVNKELKERIKNKDLSLEELGEEISELKTSILNKDEEVSTHKNTIEGKNLSIDGLEEEIAGHKMSSKDKDAQIASYKKDIQYKDLKIDELEKASELFNASQKSTQYEPEILNASDLFQDIQTPTKKPPTKETLDLTPALKDFEEEYKRQLSKEKQRHKREKEELAKETKRLQGLVNLLSEMMHRLFRLVGINKKFDYVDEAEETVKRLEGESIIAKMLKHKNKSNEKEHVGVEDERGEQEYIPGRNM